MKKFLLPSIFILLFSCNDEENFITNETESNVSHNNMNRRHNPPPRIVYRAVGVGESPDEIRNGIVAHGVDASRPGILPDISLLNHVRGSSTGNTQDNSGYVATTEIITDAINRIANRYGGNGYIYAIRPSANFIDVDGTLLHYNPYPQEREWAALGRIQFQQIIGWHRIDFGRMGPFERNPEYDARFDLTNAGGVQPQLAGFPEGDPAWCQFPWNAFSIGGGGSWRRSHMNQNKSNDQCSPQRTNQQYAEEYYNLYKNEFLYNKKYIGAAVNFDIYNSAQTSILFNGKNFIIDDNPTKKLIDSPIGFPSTLGKNGLNWSDIDAAASSSSGGKMWIFKGSQCVKIDTKYKNGWFPKYYEGLKPIVEEFKMLAPYPKFSKDIDAAFVVAQKDYFLYFFIKSNEIMIHSDSNIPDALKRPFRNGPITLQTFFNLMGSPVDRSEYFVADIDAATESSNGYNGKKAIITLFKNNRYLEISFDIGSDNILRGDFTDRGFLSEHDKYKKALAL
ncbi:Heat-labile enterotoxin alpha chain [Chishuiella changwenlii]|uniref:Heat-labile enterotoxin alpha chain n=1 Tax=Chishuiella changwenlii TaxID=1434701 RepID=A0A1M6W8T7_9FLAO|nr:enterotoxin A family protein [Chishuiella changwenlii]GGE88605.1 hypothetical protein GCM10010984_02850 [Chishuiella changwenlii]SHK90173.1 Heat-labile enterotoxin alpha chain [Chishuiella changwenlii]